MVGAQVPMF